jgi:N-acetylglucosaminyl-diphospho-decaprenol L-rhamnosyltransferase
MKAAVSAVVVHYRGAGYIERCVASCLEDPAIEEVLIVDNEGYAAGLERTFPDSRVRVLAIGHNAGYGRAANAGLAETRSPAALVLNQDVVLPAGCVGALLDVGDAMGAWLVGPRLMDGGGVIAAAKERFPWPLRWQAPPSRPGCPAPPGRFVPWVPGAALLLMPGHADLRFDERFFMYVEDEDLCARVWATGGRVVLADTLVVHAGGTATRERWSRQAIALRIVLERSRMVRAHRGRPIAAAFAVRSLSSAVARALRRLVRRAGQRAGW